MRTVVTGVDEDQASRQVLCRALAEARSAGRPLEVLHAWSTPTWASAARALDDEAAQQDVTRAQGAADAVLADALAPHVDALTVRPSTEARRGDAGEELVRAGVRAGLVVVGRRSHGPVLSAVLGSVTGFVLHYAACPVMVVPRGAATGPLRRVVVGHQDRGHSGSALRWALDAAARHRCPLLVLHALPRTRSPVRRAAQLDDARHEDGVRARLAAQVARAAAAYPDVRVTTSVRGGSPYDVLLDEAGADDLLVLGSRAHSGAAEILLGAVAVQCAQGATGTAVVVRAGQERLDDTDAAAVGRSRRQQLTGVRP